MHLTIMAGKWRVLIEYITYRLLASGYSSCFPQTAPQNIQNGYFPVNFHYQLLTPHRSRSFRQLSEFSRNHKHTMVLCLSTDSLHLVYTASYRTNSTKLPKHQANDSWENKSNISQIGLDGNHFVRSRAVDWKSLRGLDLG